MTTSSKHPDIQTKWWGSLNFTPLQKSKKIYMHIVLLPNVTSDGFHCEGNIIFPYAKKEKKNSLAFWKSAIVKVIRRTSLWAVGKFAVTNLTNLPYKGNPKKTNYHKKCSSEISSHASNSHEKLFLFYPIFLFRTSCVWTKSNSGYFLSPHAWLFVKTPVIGNGVSKGFVSVKNYQNIDVRSMIFWMSRSTANFALFFEYTFRKEIVTSYKESRKM